jgi:hypothetical protein
MKASLYYLSLLFFLLSSPAIAQNDTATADDIARKILRVDASGWEGAKTRIRMVVTEKSGSKREQVMEILGRRHQGLLQTVVRFFAPQNVAGTAFLMAENKDGASEQYVYLPGLKRTRRIVGREREGSFMGSDFSYSDLQRVEAKYAKNTRLPDEKLGEAPVYVLESKLTSDAPVQYSRVVTWIRKSDYIALRTRFYDKQGRLFKTLYVRRIRDLEGKPIIVEARMQNEQNGHTTELVVDSIQRQDKFPDAAFTPNALEHW